MAQAVEFATYRLKNANLEEFLAASTEIDAWLVCQPGFLTRHLAEGQDGSILDFTVWSSMQDGKRAFQRLTTLVEGSVMFGLIDPQSLEWALLPVAHRLAAEEP
jgi:hypothetical protein